MMNSLRAKGGVGTFLRLSLLAMATVAVGCGSLATPDKPKNTNSGKNPEPNAKQTAKNYEVFHYYPQVITNEDPSKYKVVVSAPTKSAFDKLAELDDPKAYEKVLALRLQPVKDPSLNVNAGAYKLVPSTYDVQGAQLELRPSEPLIPGRGYVVLINPQAIPGDPAPDAQKLEKWFVVPGGEPAIEPEPEADPVQDPTDETKQPEPDDSEDDDGKSKKTPLESGD